METIHELSSVAPLSEYDLWGVPPTQITVEKDVEMEYRPLAAADINSPITFLFTTSPDEYVKLDTINIYWQMQFILEKNDKSSMTKADWTNLGVSNYLQHAMIKQIEIDLNGKQVFNLPQNYPYRAYVEALLGFTNDAKESHLSSSLWINDDIKRNKFIKPADSETDQTKGKVIDLYSKIHTDLSYQGRALLGGTQIKIQITLNDPKFFCIMKNGYSVRVVLNDVKLYLHKAKLSGVVVDAHRKALNISPAKYPITRIEVKQFPIPRGLLDVWIDNMVFGQLPRRMFLFFVDNDAFNGSFEKDPFELKHYDINFLSCFLDGVQYPSIPYTPDFTKKLYIKEYMGLFEAINQNGTDSFLKMNREDFENIPIFGFNFAPDFSDGCGVVGHVNPINRGSMRLQLRWYKCSCLL